MGWRSEFRIEGAAELIYALRELPDAAEKRVLRQASTAAMRPVRTEAARILRSRGWKEKRAGRRIRRRKEELFRERGLTTQAAGHQRLHETIKQATRTYNRVIVTVVGPEYRSHGSKGNIGHLVEKGHRMVLWGKRTEGRVPAYPFMEPAFDKNVTRAQLVLMAAIKGGVEREAARLAKR